MILVAGATGRLGNDICVRLFESGCEVRALVRDATDPEKVTRLSDRGAQIVVGDLRDRASLDAACSGVSAVISTVSCMPFSYSAGANDIQHVDVEGVKALIDAACKAEVEHFVYTSFTGHIDLSFPLSDAKRATEQHLRESGLHNTILRPSYFMESWITPRLGMDYIKATAQIYGEGKKPISWIAQQDVAEFAVASLENEAARNATLELGGPEALSPLQVVKRFEAITGKPFAVEHVPVEGIQAQFAAATDPMEQSFAGLMLCYAQGDAIDMAEVLSAFPVELTSVEEYGRTVVAGVTV